MFNNILTDGGLELIPATIELLDCEVQKNNPKIFEILKVEAPSIWPPELNNDDSNSHFLNVQKTMQDAETWGYHYAVDITETRKLLGCGGFVMPPNEEGVVEIGYSILPEFRRQGYATRLAKLLVERAFKDERIKLVIAHTHPHLLGSIRVLENTGFKFMGDVEDNKILFHLAQKP